MIFLDTSFLIAMLQHRDDLHDRALAWAVRVPKPAVVTEYVLWETLNFFAGHHGRAKASQLAQRLRSDGTYIVVPASPELFEIGLRAYAELVDKQWSLTDCVSFHVMQDRKITQALTYDHHFEQAGFEALLRRDP